MIILDIENFCKFLFFSLSIAFDVVVWAYPGISAHARDLKISRETLQLNLVIGYKWNFRSMAASENGLFFVHEFKSIYTEYTIEMIVPEGYVARFVTS